MVIRDGPGFLALNQAIKHLQKRPKFELIVVSSDIKRDNMEFHLKLTWEKSIARNREPVIFTYFMELGKGVSINLIKIKMNFN